MTVFGVAVRDEFAKEWLENRLRGTVQRTLANVTGKDIVVEFVLATNGRSSPTLCDPLIEPLPEAQETIPLAIVDYQ